MSTYCMILLMLILKNNEVFSSVKHVVRCTRRYSAGYCDEEVKPVWTFVFQKQDCVMRMGCPSSLRVNRFRKYSHCIRRCKILVDMYTQILLNNTGMHDGFQGYLRRNIDSKPYLRTDNVKSKGSEEYEEDTHDLPSFDTVDNEARGDIMESNIDGDNEVHHFLDTLNDNI